MMNTEKFESKHFYQPENTVSTDQFLENRTFAEINIGDSASITRTVSKKDIQVFAVMSGDVNPAHLDEEYAAGSMFKKVIAHGIWTGGLISAVLGTKLPGPGAIYMSQSFKFLKPVGIGDTLIATVTVTAKDPEKKTVTLDCTCTNQDNKKVLLGEAMVLAPQEKITRKVVALPTVELSSS